MGLRALRALTVVSVLGAAAAIGADNTAAPPDLAHEVRSLQAVCGNKCHNLQIVTNTPRSLDEWRDTMQKMVDRGARGTDEQYDDILDYLHRTMTTIDVNAAEAQELAEVLNAKRCGGRGDPGAPLGQEIRRSRRPQDRDRHRRGHSRCQGADDLLPLKAARNFTTNSKMWKSGDRLEKSTHGKVADVL